MMTLMSALGCCARLLSVTPLKEAIWLETDLGHWGFDPGSLDLMTNFLSCFMPQAVKRQSRCPEVPYHRTGGSTANPSCKNRLSNWERQTLATRQQIKARFLSRKLTTVHHSLKSDFQSISGVILCSSVGNPFSLPSCAKASADIHQANLLYFCPGCEKCTAYYLSTKYCITMYVSS